MNWKQLFIPFEGHGKKDHVKLISFIVVPIIIWIILPNNLFPPFFDILKAFPELFQKNDLVGNFSLSIWFCIKSILYSSLIAFVFMCIARVPIMESFCIFMRKFRFLPSTGLSFLFMKITPDVNSQMKWMMIFGISTFLIDSAVNIALSITKDEVNYAKSLRLSNWQVFREVVIYSKLPDFLEAVIQNFAMAWMLLASIENIAKTNGGIGVVLAESSKYFKLESVYAIQILILLTGITMDYLLRLTYATLFPYKKLKTI
jgi:NitT/TauT family transport system permease protein